MLVLTSTAGFAGALDLSIGFVAFPAIEDDFPQASTATLSWVLTVYSIVLAALLIPGGRLADLRGRRRVFLSGVGLFGVASAIAAFAPSPFVLIAARSLQAAGGALLTPASMTLILTTFPPERRAMAVGAWGAVGGVATAVGPSIGAALIEVGGWRSVFALNVVLASLIAAGGARILDESVDPDARRLTDLGGSALIVVAVGAVALATVQGPEWGWTDPRTVGVATAGVVCAVGVVVRSRHHPEPVLDLGLFRVASFRQSNLVALTFSGAFFAMFFGLVLFLTDGWGYDTPDAGLLITPGPAAAAVMSVAGGRVADRRGHRAVMVPGALAFAAGSAWLLLSAGDDPDLVGVWLPAIVLMGIGIGLVFPSFQSAAVHGVPPDRFGVASAAVQTNVRIAATLGVAVAVAILADTGPGSPVTDYDPLFAMLVVLALGAAALSAAIDTRPAPQPTSGS